MSRSNAVLLPGNVTPKAYRITLAPDLAAFTYRGEETVEIEVLEPTTTIVLNADGLELQAAEIRRDGAPAASAQGIALDSESETATLTFAEAVQPGIHDLHIAFSGAIRDGLMGFYRSQYPGTDGQTMYLATTQFEPAHARLAFPCWDEPALKATFQMSLEVADHLDAVSNMPVVKEAAASPGRKLVEFAVSPVMSTYLLAFLVGEMGLVEERSASGTLVRVLAPRGKEQYGQFALDTSLRLLAYFNEYFGIPYPLEKLDHVAIPDFAAGAMENWGMITYRETALLVDPENSAAATRQRVAEVVSHEMAHMWFGDLVTMAWWNDLWLNESFASWMGDKAVDHVFPEWEMWTQFVSMDTVRALSLDGLNNSHPIEAEVRYPAEVEQLFDAISYSKGGSLIRMLEQFLGPETFRDGLHRYLSTHQYANARTEDLWAAMEAASGQPVSALMATWTKQMGYPVVAVESRREGGRVHLDFSQSRFLYTHLLDEGETDPSRWKVPLSIVTAAGGEPVGLLMEEETAHLDLPEPAASGPGGPWVKVNAAQTGFYRVSLPQEDWAALAPAVESRELAPTDRLGVQSDAYALSRAGYLPITRFLGLAASYREEVDSTVWRDLAGNLGDLDQIIAQEPFHDRFRTLARNLFAPLSVRMGWEARAGETHLDALLRSLALGQAGYFGDEAPVREAKRRFEGFLSTGTAIAPDLRGVVYGLAAQGGDRSTYDRLWDLERETPLQEEKMRLLQALTRFTQPDLLQDFLDRSLTDDVRSQDTVIVVTVLSMNSHGRDLAWEFIKDNWSEFDRRYGRGGFALMRLVAIPGGFATQERLEDVERFFANHSAPAAERTVRQSLEQIRLNVRWLERNRSELAGFFGA
jgi:puromycin-sensitive aminopeptidase